ncbi:hypothetical protein AMECASPLE_008522 [Ameca splendens]|uniref:Secreted protein n=1 Tax=Ameca splendens TaxID=208324 RepID=A0ABV0XD24_9TELE
MLMSCFLDHSHVLFSRSFSCLVFWIMPCLSVYCFVLLDHLFAEYWTICTLLDATRPPGVFGHFVPQDSLSYKTQRPLRLIRQGRRSPEATINYITEDETTHHLPSAGDRDTVTNI